MRAPIAIIATALGSRTLGVFIVWVGFVLLVMYLAGLPPLTIRGPPLPGKIATKLEPNMIGSFVGGNAPGLARRVPSSVGQVPATSAKMVNLSLGQSLLMTVTSTITAAHLSYGRILQAQRPVYPT